MKIEEIKIQRYTSPVVQWYKNEHEFNMLRLELFNAQLGYMIH
jgi:hypothetical protein